MANISAAQVKELREKTGAGMMDCKKALVEADGDLEQAVDFLRKKGLSAAAKKAGRITSEGKVASYISDDGKIGVLHEVNCETDFVAKNPDFISFVENLGPHIAKKAPLCIKDGEGALVDQKWIADENKTVSELLPDLIGIIGENISPRRFERWELSGDGLMHSYIHMGGKLGVLLEVGCEGEAVGSEAAAAFTKMLGMHIAASNPLTLNQDQVPEDVLDREKEIYRTQILESGKPEELVDRIMVGKVAKFYKENCLLEQVWVHDTGLNVQKAAAAASKEAGGEISIRRYVRWQLGEGLEKRANDLLAEVAEQLEGK